MASEIRVDKINSLSGVGTVTLSPTGVDIAGITTAATLRATTGIVTSLTAGSLTSLGAVSGTTGTFTGDLTIPDKIVHTGDTDTSIRLGVDTVTVETGGSERIRVDSAGRLGIGQNSPTALLHLKSNAPYITFEDDDNNQDWQIQATAWFAIRDQTNSAERLRIDSNGKVHVGLTNGSGQFNVKNSNDSSTNALEIYNDNGVRNASFSQNSSGDATMDLRTNAEAQNVLLRSNGISHFSGGDFGLGTSSPAVSNALFGGAQRTLHVSGTAAPMVRIQSSTSGQADLLLQAGNSGSDAYIANAASNGDIVFSTNNGGTQGSKLRIRHDGGINFNTDNSDATALDDYEEGSATLTLYSNTNLTLHTGYNVCDYTKIGNLVTITMLLIVNSVSGGDYVFINLPFTNRSESNPRRCDAVGAVMHTGVNTGDTGLIAYLPSGTNVMRFYKLSDNASWSILVNSDLAVGDEMYVTITYKTAT